MKRLLLLMMILLCSCEKDPSVSEKYVGDWEGVVYVFADDGDDKMLVVSNIIELTIQESSSYTCILYDFQSPIGVPVKVGEGSTSKGNVIEEGESITFTSTFADILFKALHSSDGLKLESSEYLIDLKEVE